MPSLLLILSTFSLVTVSTLISLLINFVIFYTFAGIVLIAAPECSPITGLSYLIIYTGAVSVLFVFVVLLIENQHLGLAGFVSAGYYYASFTAPLNSEISEASSLSPQPAFSLPVPLPLEVSASSSSLASVLYGESITALALVGWVLIMATFAPVAALCITNV